MSTQPRASGMGRGANVNLSLDFPRSLGSYDGYEEAQEAVDYLSDHEFPVENLLIVGTDLRQVERVTGRLTMGRVALGGVLSGLWLGLFVGLIFTLFASGEDALTTIVWCAGFGALFAVVWAIIGYRATQGRRDFTSVSQVVATRYEVLTEHKYAERAKDLLAQKSLH